jgi:DNA-binding beta-propeller fold protein YncE
LPCKGAGPFLLYNITRMRFVPAFALFVTLATPAAAQLAKVETADARIVYVDPTLTFLAPYATQTILNSLAFHKKLFQLTPHEKPTVLILDFQDYGNAWATSVPRDTVQIQVAPLSFLFETLSANERLLMIANHELVHVATMDGATGRDLAFRKLFAGKVNPIDAQPESVLYFYLTSPRVAVPRWYSEGIAVFIDTWMSAGMGRAQSGYDEMVFRAMVKDNAHIYDPLGLVAEGTKADFQVEVNSYLYGARFMTYLAYQYSPEKLIEWTSRRPGSKAYYASAFERVFGKPLDNAWADWIQFERDFQQANLAAIRKAPVTPAKDLSSRALGSISRAYYDARSQTIYAAFNYPGVVAHIGAISTETGAVRHLTDIKGPRIYQVASIAYDPDARAIYYTTDNNGLRDLVRLDVQTNKTRLLQRDLRVGDLALNPADKSLWGIRHLNGLVSIVKMAPPYTDWTRIVTLPYGEIVYDLDVSPDGTRIVVGYGDVSGAQKVRVLNVATLADRNAAPVAEFDFGPAVPSGFIFSGDGKYLWGSSYHTGVSNIFRYEIATKALEIMTNADTGFFRPLPVGGDDLIVFRFTGGGFVPARIAVQPVQDTGVITFLGERTIAKHPVLQTWEVGSPADVPFDTMAKTTGKYHLAGGLELESIYPVVQGYKDTGAVGMRADFADPLGFNHANVTVSYSPAGDIRTQERLHVTGEYQRYDWRLHATVNDADFYDLFGDTKTSRKGYSIGVGHSNTLVFDEPRRVDLKVDGRFAGNLDQLPQYQHVPVIVDTLLSLNADLTYSFTRSSLGSVDTEKGQRAGLFFRSDFANHDYFTRIHGTWDVGTSLFSHSSLWLRSAAGFSPQNEAEVFANFYFGAFGNNVIDHADEKRYRQYYSFPGAELSSIHGRNFARTMLEWSLPPARFSRAGTPGFYLSWIRPAVFVTGLVTNVDGVDTRRKAVSTGGQIDFRFTMLSTLDLTLSAGAAVAFEPGQPRQSEGMISLRLLR